VNGAASIGENASNSAALPGAVTLTAEEAHDVRKALLDIATLLQPPLPKK
jgi:hypothetical protein